MKSECFLTLSMCVRYPKPSAGVPDVADFKSHAQSVEFGERLSVLVRKTINIVEGEQAKTESTSRNVNLFLQQWRGHAEALFDDVRFFESSQIRVRDELVTNATLLREMQWGAYVQEGGGHLNVYMSGDLLGVFDSIADQLRDILRLDLLPAGLRDEIASLVQSNLARLGDEKFAVYLNQRFREKGFPIEEDEELQSLLRASIQAIEAQAQTDSEVNVQELEVVTNNPSSSNSYTGGVAPGYQKGQTGVQSEALTPDEILSHLPMLDETSYGRDNVVDLSAIAHWHILPERSRSERGLGGGSGRGRSFKSVQPYRDAYGKRGEEWVVEWERRALADAGKPDLAQRVVHRSKAHEGSPWDIESFEKSHPHRATYIEVKSTSEADNFEVEMSANQIRSAFHSQRRYYLYRVVDVHTSKPTVYIYDFKAISQYVKLSATNVSVTLPIPKNPDT